MTIEAKLFAKLPIHVAADFQQLDTGTQFVSKLASAFRRPARWCCLLFFFILVVGTALGGRARDSLEEARADQATYAIASPPPPVLFPPPAV